MCLNDLFLDFQEDEIYTVREQGWNGIGNGELLKLMLEEGFDVLLTFDKNLQHQQNFIKHPLCVIVLTAESNRYTHLQPLVESIKEILDHPTVGVTIVGT